MTRVVSNKSGEAKWGFNNSDGRAHWQQFVIAPISRRLINIGQSRYGVSRGLVLFVADGRKLSTTISQIVHFFLAMLHPYLVIGVNPTQ